MGKYIKENFGQPTDTILLFPELYVGRAVMVSRASGTIAQDSKGRYIIPAGTFLTGGFMKSPQALATIVDPSDVRASLTTALTNANANTTYTARDGGVAGNGISVVYAVADAKNEPLTISVSGTVITVNLATDAAKAVISTANDVNAAVNQDQQANSLVVAVNKAGETGDGIVNAMASTALTGGLAGSAQTADGILFYDVDVTDGPEAATAMISGFVNLDNLPEEPTPGIETSLKMIQFGRID